MWLWNVKAAHASLHFSTEIRLNIQGMKYVCQKKIVNINFSNSIALADEEHSDQQPFLYLKN